MLRARRFACVLAFGGLCAFPALGGCEAIAGYDDAQPWPAEASLLDAINTTHDSAVTSDVVVPPPDTAAPIDAPTETSVAGDTGIADTGIADTSVVDTGPVLPDASFDAAPTCPVLSGGAVCTQIPRFTAAAQIVDGVGDEFCDVPATTYPVENAAYKKRAVAGTSFNEIATFRIAWSPDALHVHAHVVDPMVLVPTTTDLYSGDAIVIYFSGGSVFSGAFTGTNDDGAMQVLVSPAAGGLPTRAYVFYWLPGAKTVALDPSLFASRLVPDGYEVELMLPWSPQKDPNSITIGGSIGIDPGVIVKDNPAAAGQELEATLGFRPLPTNATTTCESGFFAPWCDDRTWCVSTLQ